MEESPGFFDISLPPGWLRATQPDHSTPQAIWWQAQAPDDDDVCIGRYVLYRASGDSHTSNIVKILEAEDHELNEDEIWTTDAMRMMFPFEFDSTLHRAYTKKIAGLMCIVLERDWMYPTPRRSFEVLLDPYKNARFVNHFYFAAPPDQYDKYLPIALQCFETLAPEAEPAEK